MTCKNLTASILTVLAIIMFFSSAVPFAQDSFEPAGETYIIREPAAWTRPSGEFSLQMGMIPFFARGELGILDYLTAGVSYGGMSMLGSGKIDPYPRPYMQIRFRITNGGMYIPAIAVGYDDQGQGRYYEEEIIREADNRLRNWDRFRVKAKGFYGVMSQEYEAWGPFGIHFGININLLETGDDDTHPNIFAAMEKGLGQHIMLIGSYDAALNDNGDTSFGDGKGFLNAGVRWRVVSEFNIEFYMMNLLENQKEVLEDEGGMNRMLMITYKNDF